MTSFSENLNEDYLKNFTDEIANLIDLGKLPFATHLSSGNEKELIKIFKKINDDDFVISTHRNHYHALLHGLPKKFVINKILNGQSMFMFSKKRNFLVSAIIGGTPAIAAGLALAIKKKKIKKHVWCFVGDGIEDSGHYYEAVRYVQSMKLPCTFILEDNNMAVNTSKKERWGISKNVFSTPNCVKRYYYKNIYPHIRTKNKSPKNILKKTIKEFYKDREPYGTQQKKTLEVEREKSNFTYKENIQNSMNFLGKKDFYFIGYGVKNGNAMGSLKDVDDEQKIETPVAENLMVGLGIGMSLMGLKCLIFFERHDFMLVAADAIINHLDKLEWISKSEFCPNVILKTVVDDGKLTYSGPTHSQNFTKMFRGSVKFPIIDLKNKDDIFPAYKAASLFKGSVMLVEHKRLF